MPETHTRKRGKDLVASEIAHAAWLLDQADVPGRQTDNRLLLNAAESVRRTKNLLSVIELEGADSIGLQERLVALQARLLGRK